MTKHKYEVRYRIRPLGLIVTALAPEVVKHDSIEIEAHDERDALTVFANHMHNMNLEERGNTHDLIAVVQVD